VKNIRNFDNVWYTRPASSPQKMIQCHHRVKQKTANNSNNSIRVYLRADLTAQRPITKLARVYRSTQI
jgi:hypothetical protein